MLLNPLVLYWVIVKRLWQGVAAISANIEGVPMARDTAFENDVVPVLADSRIRGKVLIVDDEKSIGNYISALLQKNGHQTRAVTSGFEAIAIADEGWPDLVVLDLVMADMDGFETARRLKSNPQTAHIPVVMLTVLGDRESRLRGLEIGAEDFLTKPIDPAELVIRVRNLLRLKEYGDFLSNMNHLLDRQVRQKTAELRGCHVETIFALARVVEFKDHETAQHISRIAHLSRAMAEILGMAPGYTESIFYASAMHDIGKVIVPAAILLKPGPLTPEEMALMRRHPEVGAEILAAHTASPFLTMGAEVAASHHECWDGSGYPKGTSGERIPLSGRIVLLCDRYDAVRSKRPYKEAKNHEDAVRILTTGDGRSDPGHFDPDVLAAFRRFNGRLEEIFEANALLQ